MEIRIGVLHTAKELEIDLGDDADDAELTKRVEAALSGKAGGVFWVTDRRGRKVGVPAERLAYVDIGSRDDRRVGFGTH